MVNLLLQVQQIIQQGVAFVLIIVTDEPVKIPNHVISHHPQVKFVCQDQFKNFYGPIPAARRLAVARKIFEDETDNHNS